MMSEYGKSGNQVLLPARWPVPTVRYWSCFGGWAGMACVMHKQRCWPCGILETGSASRSL